MQNLSLPPLFALSEETKTQLLMDCAKNHWVTLARVLIEDYHGVSILQKKETARNSSVLNNAAVWNSLVELNEHSMLQNAWDKMMKELITQSQSNPDDFKRPLDFFLPKLLMMSLVMGKNSSATFFIEKLKNFNHQDKPVGGYQLQNLGLRIKSLEKSSVVPDLYLTLNPLFLEKVPLLSWNPLAVIKIFPHEGETLTEEQIKEKVGPLLQGSSGVNKEGIALSFVECIVRCAPPLVARDILRHIDADTMLMGSSYYECSVVGKKLRSEKVSSQKSGLAILERFFQLIEFDKKGQGAQEKIITALGLEASHLDLLLGSVSTEVRQKSREIFPKWLYERWLLPEDTSGGRSVFIGGVIQCARINDLSALEEAFNLIKERSNKEKLKEAFEECESAKQLTVLQRLIESPEAGSKEGVSVRGQGVSVEGLIWVRKIIDHISPTLFTQSLAKKAVVWSDKSQRARKQSDFLGMCVLENRLDLAHWLMEVFPKIDLKCAKDLAKYLEVKGHKEHSKVMSAWEHLLLSKKIDDLDKKRGVKKQEEDASPSMSSAAPTITRKRL